MQWILFISTCTARFFERPFLLLAVLNVTAVCVCLYLSCEYISIFVRYTEILCSTLGLITAYHGGGEEFYHIQLLG